MSLAATLLRHAIDRLRTAAYAPGDDGLVTVRRADLRLALARLDIKPAPHHDPATCPAPVCREGR